MDGGCSEACDGSMLLVLSCPSNITLNVVLGAPPTRICVLEPLMAATPGASAAKISGLRTLPSVFVPPKLAPEFNGRAFMRPAVTLVLWSALSVLSRDASESTVTESEPGSSETSTREARAT